ncbi:response regulator [Cohnella sp. GCM10020058]|uniref:response regulator transcription factor n=1 Tax=Cohnella sp. GCM10020058 TaxID=3317330 RepID=UPI003629F0BB
MLKALIVDDEYLVRAGIRETVDWPAYGVEIVGDASNGLEGLDMALRHCPDVIITDVRMPFMNGLEFLEKIREHGLSCGVIVLSGYDEFQYAQEAIRHGADTYLLKPVDTEELANAVVRIGKRSAEQAAERLHFRKLKDEENAIATQFWLDLLFGRTSDPGHIQDKYDWLGIAIPPGEALFVGAIAVVPDTLSQGDFADGGKWDAAEKLIRLASEDLELPTIAIVRSATTEWALIAALGDSLSDAASALYGFGYRLIRDIQDGAGLQVTAGFAQAADPYAGIHPASVRARDAARKSISGLGGVLFDSEDERAGMRREIRDALAYIRLHFAENITADMVAEQVHVSATHLMHLFRKDLNKTFYECLTEFRIGEAKRLLRHSSYRVYEVGLQVGFGDSKYFSQIFRKMTGLSPSEYAKSHQ